VTRPELHVGFLRRPSERTAGSAACRLSNCADHLCPCCPSFARWLRTHASPVLLNDPAYVGVAVTSLPGRPGFQRVRTRRWITTRWPRSSEPLPDSGPIRQCCWPTRPRGYGSCPARQRRETQHELGRLAGWFRRSPRPQRLGRSRADQAAPAAARPHCAACGSPG
jgi:hypothetical protein